MRTINKVILVGNVTRDPEKKVTTNGQSITTFGVATNREWVTSAGVKQSMAEFTNIAVWGKLADICAQYLKKGKLVYIEGYLKTRSWDNEQGVRIYRTEVVATDMIMLDKRKDDHNDTSDSGTEDASQQDPGMPGDNEAGGNMFDPGDAPSVNSAEDQASDSSAEPAQEDGEEKPAESA